MLDIKIFDVAQGFCAAIDIDSHTILIDSGYNSTTGFRPSQYILQKHHSSLDCLVVPAYTEDHLAGFSNLLSQSLEHCLPINFLISNPSINPEQFPELKLLNQKLRNSLTSMTESGKSGQTMKINGVNISFFWNNYPDFQEPHNLSLVTFVSYRDINIIFPSDLETEGWRTLLKSPDFRDRLRQVKIFVASDHGQEKGYCQEVFNYCEPEVVIVSNKTDEPTSSQMMQQYQSHAHGSSFRSEKTLLTTRDDGNITISKYLDGLRQITTQSKSHR
jgi:beta-lactamase superfamily II metal-dependent hydrolase